jgi:hypothetical protein
MLGPVSNEPMSPWVLIVFGAIGAAYMWVKYLSGNLRSRIFPGDNLVQVAFASVVFGVLILEGAWHLLR